jgi:NADPH:quinone reductase-like Zn-dependent oxidoreductase
MKAVVYTQYGSPDVLELKEVEKPFPRDDEVLVRVHAVSLNASDWEFLTGTPLYTRMWGLFKPGYRILGSDVAGRVESVGRNAAQFKTGDPVFGDILETKGCLAEYVCAPEKELRLKPASLTFVQAAAIPQAASVALQGLRDKGQLRQGERVLINGAGGGAGSFAVQMARHFGAEVTGVDNTGKLEMMRSIGANHVIDYTVEDFTKNGRLYDLVLDFVAHRSIFDCRRSLSPEGRYVMVGGCWAPILQALFLGPLISMVSARKMGLLLAKPNRDLDCINELIESGKVVPAVDRCYSLGEVSAAFRHLGEGHAKGKVVIIMERSIFGADRDVM